MSNLVRWVIIAAAVTALLAVIFILLLVNRTQKTSDIIVFSSGQATDVRSVFVSNEYGDFHFHFDFEEGGYVTDDIPPFLVDLDAFVEFLARSSQLSALRTISSDAHDLRETGVSSPLATVKIEFFDGSNFSLAIGAMERVSGNYYALVSGTGLSGNYVYIIPQSLAEQFLLPKTQVITKYLTPQLALSSPLSAIRNITFEGGSLPGPVVIK